MKTLTLAALAVLTTAIALPAAAQTRSAQSVPNHEALPAEQDPTQDPAELARTRALNAEVVARLDAVDRHNAEAEATNAANRTAHAMDLEAEARANATHEADVAAYEASARAAAAAQARYEADMIVWRQRVRDCESGVRAACAPE